jgi:hypothetical protein
VVYSIRFERPAFKNLAAIPKRGGARIVVALERLAADPFAPGLDVKRLQGRDGIDFASAAIESFTCSIMANC